MQFSREQTSQTFIDDKNPHLTGYNFDRRELALSQFSSSVLLS